jgi:hypothetical protein
MALILSFALLGCSFIFSEATIVLLRVRAVVSKAKAGSRRKHRDGEGLKKAIWAHYAAQRVIPSLAALAEL